ncbi:DODA-type extradiol aromatic ring-opening family dioxygenase [Nannocystaceae bacterium ST9]
MTTSSSSTKRQPTLYIPHGGGPCFFMDWTMGPADTWNAMAEWLRSVGREHADPRALLVVSAHWEQPVATVLAQAQPDLLFDYYGFPPHTYQLEWPAPGAPELASRVRGLLGEAGLASAEERQRGFDHGVFVPLKVAYPEPTIPTLQLSLVAGLDPAQHLAIGRALAPLRDEGVLIIGSGMSYHDMRGFGRPASLGLSQQFDGWLAEACGDASGRDAALTDWERAPAGRRCHPREEHLLPLMVAAGAAAGESGRRVFQDRVMGVQVSAFEFGDA